MHSSRRGFTATELVVIFVICGIMAAFLYPLFAQSRRPKRSSCLSNVKQVALALLSYVQDHDERLPPVVGATREGGRYRRLNWAPGLAVSPAEYPGSLLDPYIKSSGLFRCPEARSRDLPTFRYNDLAATGRLEEFASSAQTVVLMEGDAFAVNSGHDRPGEAARDADCTPTPQGRCKPGAGTPVSKEAASRHAGGGNLGGNFAFVDGHVKWWEHGPVEGHPRGKVFYPAAESVVLTADPEQREPVPGGDMEGYAATFHVR